MLRRSPFARWVPRYFGRTAHPREKRGNVAPRGGGSLRGPAANKYGEDAAAKGEASRHEGEVQTSSATDLAITGSSHKLVRKAEALFGRWQALGGTVVNHSVGCEVPAPHSVQSDSVRSLPRNGPRDAVLFTAQTEVFAVLKTILPRVERCGEASSRDAFQQKPTREGELSPPVDNLVVIPDEVAENPKKFLHHIERHRTDKAADCVALSGDAHSASPGFSMREILVFLRLYHAVESEDGVLLLQLLEELRRAVFKPQERHVDEARKGNGDENSVIPQLLLTLSELGLVEERVLEKLTTLGGCFLSRRQIFCYPECDLVRLLVAFHRFKLHHEPCFKATMKALRQKTLRSPLKSFLLGVRAQQDRNALDEGTNKGGIPSCMTGLTVNELLEALSAIALSLYRERAVVELLVATILAAVREDEEKFGNSISGEANAGAKNLGVLRTLQIHRAAKICEQMEMAQPVLAHLLHRLSVSYGGLIVDGGEGPLNPERVGFYDFITADLVKVVRS